MKSLKFCRCSIILCTSLVTGVSMDLALEIEWVRQINRIRVQKENYCFTASGFFRRGTNKANYSIKKKYILSTPSFVVDSVFNYEDLIKH